MDPGDGQRGFKRQTASPNILPLFVCVCGGHFPFLMVRVLTRGGFAASGGRDSCVLVQERGCGLAAVE
eukprot:10138660-Prorocentrum_lima.AAC.1